MSNPKPFWQTLKLILSVLMVLLFYLEKISLTSISLHDPIMQGSVIPFSDITGYLLQGTLLGLNMVLIPMFIFIAAYLTQGSTIKEIYQSLLPAFITYCAFQLINTIPLLLEDRFSWQALLLFPLDGVWFILAVPVWQGLSFCLSAFSGNWLFKAGLFLLFFIVFMLWVLGIL